MDNSPMNPNLTPSGVPRARAQALEADADRALFSAEWAFDCDAAPDAAPAYRRAARAFLRAAALREEAAALEGGTVLDRELAAWFRVRAVDLQAIADRLAAGDMPGA